MRSRGDTADNKLEIVALTETWLSNDDGDQRYVKEMTPSEYKCVHKPRKGRGWGVALLYKTGIGITMRRGSSNFD